MRKYFAVILSFYILVMAIIPCVDKPDEKRLQQIEISQQAHDNHDHEADNCSAFCTCQCCSTSVDLQAYTIRFKCLSFASKVFYAYSFTYDSSFSISIFQPPKIS